MRFKHGSTIWLGCYLTLIFWVCPAVGRIHELSLVDDSRQHFKIEDFGFLSGGKISINIDNIVFTPTDPSEVSKPKFGVLLRCGDTESDVEEDLIASLQDKACPFDEETPRNVIKLQMDHDYDVSHSFTSDDEGMYMVEFIVCYPKGQDADRKMSIDVKLSLSNPGGYLSAGSLPLPAMYKLCSLIFFVTFLYWVVILRKRIKNVHRVHIMMAALLLLKCCTLFFKGVTKSNINKSGTIRSGFSWKYWWELAFYFFALLKGIMMFVVILLVGAGWSILKPHLNEKEKNVLIFVVPLQVMANVAMIVLDESPPGSISWIAWKHVFLIVDFACFVMVLIPIMWSIQKMSESLSADGKMKRSLEKLNLFSQFYKSLLAYLYSTRMFIVILKTWMPYKQEWVADFCTEVATLAFYVYTGYAFRPQEHNPYLKIATDDDLTEEDMRQVREKFGGEREIELAETEFGLGDIENDNQPSITVI